MNLLSKRNLLRIRNKSLMFIDDNKHLFIVSLIVVVLLGIAAGGFLLINRPAPESQPEATDLVKKVSKFILLPEGEVPTIATVSDYTKLKDQSFFEKSQNGDKVLIYTKAKKAYLYRPSTDRLMDVTIVNVNADAAQQSATTSADLKPAEIKIVLRNGTLSVGLTNKMEPEIKKVIPNAVIVNKENAAKNDYQTTVVVVLNESVRQSAIAIADYLKAAITNLPAGESKPNDADILVIIGKDKVQ